MQDRSAIHLPVTICFVLSILATLTTSSRAQELTSVKKNGRVIVRDGDQAILVYNQKTVEAPKGIDPLYNRSGHLHPIKTPRGKTVTDDFSDDHAHQHGLFFAFVKAKTDTETLDFWNQHKRNANVRSEKVISVSDSKIQTSQVHYRLRDNKTIFHEVWSIQPAKVGDCYVFDVEVKIRNVTKQPITILKNHYGSFGLRGSGQWRDSQKTHFDFTTSTGKSRQTGNLSRESWVAMHGKIDGDFCGVAVVGHPENFRAPQPARLHPSMPYFSFAPMANDSFLIKAQQVYRSRFRIITFDGKLDSEQIDKLAKF